MSDREATSELSSSIHEGVGYDKVYPSRREPKEDSPRSLEREPSNQSLMMKKGMRMRKLMRKMMREMSIRREMRKMRKVRRMRGTSPKEERQ